MKVKFICDFEMNDGLSQHISELVLAVEPENIEISCTNVKIPFAHTGESPYYEKIEKYINKFEECDVAISCIASEVAVDKNAKLNGYCVFYEADRLPNALVDLCNKFDFLISTNEITKRTAEISGVKVPIFVLHGYYYDFGIPPRKDFVNFVNDIFTNKKCFFSMFQWNYRKGWDILFPAYWLAFDDKDDVALVIKTGWNFTVTGKNFVTEVVEEMKKRYGLSGGRAAKKTAPVYFIFDVFDFSDLAELYKRACCFVLPTRGEGWGRPLLEAAYYGTPIIATNFGAHLEFLNYSNAHLIDYQLVPCSHYTDAMFNNQLVYPPTSNWANPSILDLRNKMRFVYENGGINSSSALKNISKEDTCKTFMGILKKLETLL